MSNTFKTLKSTYDDVEGAHSLSGENTSGLIEVAEVGNDETDGVDAPTDRDDQTESGKGLSRGGGSETRRTLSSGPGEDFVDDVQPGGHTEGEADELGHDVDLSQPPEDDHEQGGGEQSHTQSLRHISRSLEDEVELDDLEGNGDLERREKSEAQVGRGDGEF